tara:strand:+ start:259 stop:1002 length:744 start_codon:yes stop_codon:yes gene_type:complete
LKSETTYCKNCEAIVSEQYCPNCGQRTNVDKVTFKETFQDLVDNIFSVNAPFFITLKLLFVNPGRLFREYLRGRRKTYYKPVSFFILITLVYLLVRALIDYDPFQNSTITVEDNSQSQLLTQARNFMMQNIDKFLFLFVINLGILLKLFFYKKYRLAEFLAIGFYVAAVYTLMTTLNMFYVQYINLGFQFLAMLLMSLYFCYTMVSFFQTRKILTAIKSIVIFFMGIFSYGMLAFALSYVLILLKNP